MIVFISYYMYDGSDGTLLDSLKQCVDVPAEGRDKLWEEQPKEENLNTEETREESQQMLYDKISNHCFHSLNIYRNSNTKHVPLFP